MALINLMQSNMRLIYENGFDDEGFAIFKARSYNDINTDATPDQIYAAAHAIATLSALQLYTVERSDKHEIVE